MCVVRKVYDWCTLVHPKIAQCLVLVWCIWTMKSCVWNYLPVRTDLEQTFSGANACLYRLPSSPAFRHFFLDLHPSVTLVKITLKSIIVPNIIFQMCLKKNNPIIWCTSGGQGLQTKVCETHPTTYQIYLYNVITNSLKRSHNYQESRFRDIQSEFAYLFSFSFSDEKLCCK